MSSSNPNNISGSSQARQHLRRRAAAERRLNSYRREFGQTRRQAKREVRSLRRDAETTAIEVRAQLAEVALRSLRWLTPRRGRQPSGQIVTPSTPLPQLRSPGLR
jgi:hypothetical protein